MKGDCGEGGGGSNKITDCTASVSCFTSLFIASDSTRPKLYLSLFVRLTVHLRSLSFILIHLWEEETRSRNMLRCKTIGLGCIRKDLLFCGRDVVKEDWGHTSSEKATYTKVGQNNQDLSVNRMKLKPVNIVFGSVWVCGLNPLILIIILHQRSNKGWGGKTGSERLGAA